MRETPSVTSLHRSHASYVVTKKARLLPEPGFHYMKLGEA